MLGARALSLTVLALKKGVVTQEYVEHSWKELSRWCNVAGTSACEFRGVQSKIKPGSVPKGGCVQSDVGQCVRVVIPAAASER